MPPKKKAPAKKTESPVEKKQPPEKNTKDKTPRLPSAYNIFMKKELTKLKEQNPQMDHKERFKLAANNWSKEKK
jgi:hypothetical protein